MVSILLYFRDKIPFLALKFFFNSNEQNGNSGSVYVERQERKF